MSSESVKEICLLIGFLKGSLKTRPGLSESLVVDGANSQGSGQESFSIGWSCEVCQAILQEMGKALVKGLFSCWISGWLCLPWLD